MTHADCTPDALPFDIVHATAAKPEKDNNDDAAGHEGRLFWLLDGATQLVKPAHGLDAAWHTRCLSAALRKFARQTPEAPLSDLAAAAVTEVGEAFYAQSGLTAAAPQDLRPFSTLILCRLQMQPRRLEYFLLCDSVLAVVSSLRQDVMRDDRLERHDFLSHTTALLRAGHGFDSIAYKAALRSAYDASQPLLNSAAAGAWYVVAQDDKSLAHAVRGEIALADDDDVLLMSDGFTRAVDTLDLYADYRALRSALAAKGAAAVIGEIRAAERVDAQGMKYPRSSRHDDATLLWLRPR